MQKGEDTNSDDKDEDALSPENYPKVCEDDSVKEEEKGLEVNSQKEFGIAGSRRTRIASRIKSDHADEKEWWKKFSKGDHKEHLDVTKKVWMADSKDGKVFSESNDDSGSTSESGEDGEAMLLGEEINKLAKKLEKLEARKKETKGKRRKKMSMDTSKADLTDIRKAWRPPFKIIGQIGKIGQKDSFYIPD